MTSYLTFETMGTVDENGVLQIEPLRGVPAGRVRVSVALAREAEDYSLEEVSDEQWRCAMQNASALAFLADPGEDIYTLEDGQPIEWEKP